MALKPINKENFFAQNPTSPYHYLLDFFTDFRISSKDALLLFLPNLYCLTMKPQHFCSSEFGRNKMCYIINLWLALMKGREVQGTVQCWVFGDKLDQRFGFDGKIFEKSPIFFHPFQQGSIRNSLANWGFRRFKVCFSEFGKVQGSVS